MSALAERIRELAGEPGTNNTVIAQRAGTTEGYVSVVLRRAGIDIVSGRRRSTDPHVAKYRNPPRAKISRPCLCCGGRFWSEGPHNRMCTECRHLPTGWP